MRKKDLEQQVATFRLANTLLSAALKKAQEERGRLEQKCDELLDETDAMQQEIDDLQTALMVANETIATLADGYPDSPLDQCETDEAEFASARFVNG